MSNRITVMIDDDNEKKVRTYQSKMIQKTNGAYSFSRSLNDILRSKV